MMFPGFKKLNIYNDTAKVTTSDSTHPSSEGDSTAKFCFKCGSLLTYASKRLVKCSSDDCQQTFIIDKGTEDDQHIIMATEKK